MTPETLELLKRHCRADDFEDPKEDTYFEHLYEAALEAVVDYTHRSVDELKEMGGGDFPKSLFHAVIMLAAQLHHQRESESGQYQNTDHYFGAVLKRFRKLT